MIKSKTDYKYYIRQDALANKRKRIKAKLIGDDIWKFILLLRLNEYIDSWPDIKRKVLFPYVVLQKYRFYRLSIRCGFSIPTGCFREGLSIAHRGALVVNPTARIGKNCRIHENVNIGSTNGENQAAIIGDNVFIATGVKIIGSVKISDNVAIGAGAVVVKDILENGTTWAGVPAKKVSNNDSHAFIAKTLLNDIT